MENRNAGVRLKGSGNGVDDLTIPAGRRLNILPNRAPGYGQRIAMQDFGLAQLAKHGFDATRIEEILHQMFSRWLNVNQVRQLRSETVPVIQFQRNADASGPR